MKAKAQKSLPKVVSSAEWEKAHKNFLVKEKAATRERDRLAAERRRLPMTEIAQDYVFNGPKGNVTLLDLFGGRRQLLLYHFMFAPGVDGWPNAACPGCSLFLDQVGRHEHMQARDASFAVVSRAPLKNIRRYLKRMEWNVEWVSSEGSTFNEDFGLTTAEGEDHGLSVFLRNGRKIYRTYFTQARGLEYLGSVWSFLDLTPLGRQEKWEDTPPGRGKQSEPFTWWYRHDEY